MGKAAAETAQLLLDAHVAFVLERLEGDAFPQWLRAELDAILADAGKLKLREVVTPAAVKATARHYAGEMSLGGAMPALVGEIARRLHAHPIHERTTLSDLLPDAVFAELLDKALDLGVLRDALIRESVTNPIYSQLITELLYTGIRDYLANNPMTDRLPGARSALKLGKAVMARARPELGAAVEENLKAWVSRNARSSLAASEAFLRESFDDDGVRKMVLELWENTRHLPVSSARDYLSAQDIEEFFVIGYEYFQHLRGTAYFGALIDTGIDAFFDVHGKDRLDQLLDSIGIDREMMLADALRFAPPVIKALRKKKLLDGAIRRQLEPFYRSAAALGILASR